MGCLQRPAGLARAGYQGGGLTGKRIFRRYERKFAQKVVDEVWPDGLKSRARGAWPWGM